MRSFRSKPVGWRYESHRHSLAAHGVSTAKKGYYVRDESQRLPTYETLFNRLDNLALQREKLKGEVAALELMRRQSQAAGVEAVEPIQDRLVDLEHAKIDEDIIRGLMKKEEEEGKVE